METFQVLTRVHFMHTICRFEYQEVRSPTLQMLGKSELKRRSYGHLKTTASSYAKFRSCEMGCEMACKNVPWLRNGLQAMNQVANHLQVTESPPSCEITNST